jgi:hypothetical protein
MGFYIIIAYLPEYVKSMAKFKYIYFYKEHIYTLCYKNLV